MALLVHALEDPRHFGVFKRLHKKPDTRAQMK